WPVARVAELERVPTPCPRSVPSRSAGGPPAPATSRKLRLPEAEGLGRNARVLPGAPPASPRATSRLDRALPRDCNKPVLSLFRRLFRSRGDSSPFAAAIGRRGEREAEKLLKSKGFVILARNWRSGRDEIDLVCIDGKAVVFVAVRARAKDALVSGYDSIDRRKREAL